MTQHTQPHVRPTGTADPHAEDPLADDLYRVPLLGLRGRDRPRITPETCRMPQCPICGWMREGLLDVPDPQRAA